MLEFIKSIAGQAGDIIKAGYQRQKNQVSHKGNIDLVTDIDLKSEDFLVKAIKDKYPSHSIITEEKDNLITESNHRWVIDPLDGTTNFSHHYPFCAVSIALEIDNRVEYAVVYNPIFSELFWSQRGKGAFLNGKKINVSQTVKISNSLVATGFPYDRWEKGDIYIKEFLAFMKRTQGVRRAGAAAIDLCYTAAGRLDGFFERKLKPWDMAAGSLILAEAGGKISRYDGSDWHYNDDTIVASNQKIHNKMIDILNLRFD